MPWLENYSKYVYTLCGYTVSRSELVGIKDGQVACWNSNHVDGKIFIFTEDEVFYSEDDAVVALKDFLVKEKARLREQYNYDMKLIDSCLLKPEVY